MLIAIEGIDGSGKETQSKMLVDFLGNKFKRLSFPDYDSPTGKIIKALLSNPSIDKSWTIPLFTEDKLGKIEQLRAGNLVLDRYLDSGTAYQFANLFEQDRSLFNKVVYTLSRMEQLLKLPTADVTFFLDVTPELSQNLLKARAIETGEPMDANELDLTFMKNVYNTYSYMYKEEPVRQDVVIIECERNGEMLSPEEIHRDIVTKLGLFYLKKKFHAINNPHSPPKSK